MRREFHSFSRHRLLIRNRHGLFSFSHSDGFFMEICRAFWSSWALNLGLIWVCFERFIGQVFIFIMVFKSVEFFVFTWLDLVAIIFWYWLFTFWLNQALGQIVWFQRLWYPFWEVHQRWFFIWYCSQLVYQVNFLVLYHLLVSIFYFNREQCFRLKVSWIISLSSFRVSSSIIKICTRISYNDQTIMIRRFLFHHEFQIKNSLIYLC